MNRIEPVVEAAAWTRTSIGGKAGLLEVLTDAHLDALEMVLSNTRRMPPQADTRQQFDDPLLNSFLAAIRNQLIHGRGVAIIRGLDPRRFTPDDIERVCWGFGTHWGIAAAQSPDGDRLGRVRVDPNTAKSKAFQSPRELTFHSDAYELLGLMCVQDAASGGHTRLVSALSVHNEILKSRPDLLAPLYRGFPYATDVTGATVTSANIPVFSSVEGRVSCMYLPRHMRRAAELTGVQLPSELEEAMQYLEQVAMREDLAIEFSLEPGEMVILHNFTNLHARTEFTDSDVKRRYLLRLWLSVPDGGRPFCPALAERSSIYDRILGARPATSRH
jgi:hypothetical protein